LKMAPIDRPYYTTSYLYAIVSIVCVVLFLSYLTFNNRDLEIWVVGYRFVDLYFTINMVVTIIKKHQSATYRMRCRDFRPISHFISETIRNRAIVTMERQ